MPDCSVLFCSRSIYSFAFANWCLLSSVIVQLKNFAQVSEVRALWTQFSPLMKTKIYKYVNVLKVLLMFDYIQRKIWLVWDKERGRVSERERERGKQIGRCATMMVLQAWEKMESSGKKRMSGNLWAISVIKLNHFSGENEKIYSQGKLVQVKPT